MSLLLLLSKRPTLRLPYSLDFATLPDGAVPGWLGSATVAAGACSVVPTAGAELLADPGLEANYTAGKCDTLSLSGSPIVAESADAHGGSKAQQFTATASTDRVNWPGVVPDTGTWYRTSVWAKRTLGAAGQANVRFFQTGGVGVLLPIISAGYAEYVTVGRAANTNPLLLYAVYQLGTAGYDTVIVDDGSLKPLLLSTLFSGPALRLGRADVRVSAAWTGTAGTQAGVAIVDNPLVPTCGIVAYHDGTNLHLDKWTTPTTWTSLINVAAAYGAGRAVELWRSGTTVQAWYNDVQVGGDQTVADQNILDARHVVLFSTYDGNTASQFNVEAA